ncbi:hypothetical protein [Flindersiella endophytica]
MRRLWALLLVACAAVLAGAGPAAAAAGRLDIVHSERVELGDSTLIVSFTRWPLQENRSLDFTFAPAGGIQERTARLRAIDPSGRPAGTLGQLGAVEDDSGWFPLPRHPRDRSVWGLDVVSLPEEGRWRFEFEVKGPEGTSTASLPLEVGPQPGPPYALSWTVAMLPWILLIPLLAYGWVRARPLRLAGTRAWSG